MNIQFDEIVPAEDLCINSSCINKKLTEKAKIFVFDNNRPQFVVMTVEEYERISALTFNSTANTSTRLFSTSATNIKIGTLVQDSMRHLINDRILPDNEIERLTDSKYCSETFGLSFPVLKLYDPRKSFDEQKRDSNHYNRYYNFRLYIDDRSYLLCSQWVESIHRKRYESWLNNWQ